MIQRVYEPYIRALIRGEQHTLSPALLLSHTRNHPLTRTLTHTPTPIHTSTPTHTPTHSHAHSLSLSQALLDAPRVLSPGGGTGEILSADAPNGRPAAAALVKKTGAVVLRVEHASTSASKGGTERGKSPPRDDVGAIGGGEEDVAVQVLEAKGAVGGVSSQVLLASETYCKVASSY